MARTRELKKRMEAVRTIQRITKTMQMIATAKFTNALSRATASKPYAERMRGLVEEVIAASPGYSHPLIDGPAESPNRQRLLVISSDRGLCGAYNGNVLRAGLGKIRELRDAGVELDLETAGKKAVGFFKFQKIDIAERHTPGDTPGYDEIEALADRYIADFSAGAVDSVWIAYMQFVSNARQAPRVLELLPLRATAGTPETSDTPDTASRGARALYEFSPSMHAILDELLPVAVRSTLFQSFLDAAVSEQIMRMVAMKAATENARDLGRTLTRRYNRARQTQITTELMEVVGGAAALE